MKEKKSRKKMKQLVEVVRVSATAERGSGREAVDGGGAERESSSGGGYTSSAMEVTTFNQRFRSVETEFPVWEKIGAVVRLSYGIGELYFFLSGSVECRKRIKFFVLFSV